MNIPIEMNNHADEFIIYERIKELCFELGRQEMDIDGEEILELARKGHFEALRALEAMVDSPRTAKPYFLKFDLGLARDALKTGREMKHD